MGILMVVIAIMNTITPQYSMFFSQKYTTLENTLEVCTLLQVTTLETKTCVMSNISTIFKKISVGLPLFGTIIFFSNVGFLTVNFAFFIYSLCTLRATSMTRIQVTLRRSRAIF